MKLLLYDTVLRLPYINPVLSTTWIPVSSLSQPEDQHSDCIWNTERAGVKSVFMGGIHVRQ